MQKTMSTWRFSAKNIESICSVGNSTKKGNRKRGYIGEKGKFLTHSISDHISTSSFFRFSWIHTYLYAVCV